MRLPVCTVAALLSTMALPACGVYLHDERLVTPATTAETSLTSANTVAAFDTQLAHLKSFAAEEDLAVARYLVAVRDRDMAQLIAGNYQSPKLSEVVDGRIKELAENYLANDRALLDLSDAEAELARQAGLKELRQREVARALKAYERQLRDPAQGLKPDAIEARLAKAGCKDMRAALSRPAAQALAASADKLEKARGTLALDCWNLDDTDGRIAAVLAQVTGAGGLLRDIGRAVAAAEADVATDLSPATQKLQTQIAAAEAASKRADKESLAALRGDIRKALDGLGAASRLAGLEKVDEAIGKLLKAEVCSQAEGTVDAAKLEEAKCDEVEPTSTTGKVSASWAFAEALSQLLQAQDKDLRSTQWLLAAKAIVAAEKADAKLKADQARATAIAERTRLMAHLRELSGLVSARRKLAGTGSAECQGGDLGCAFGYYVTSWDNGRIQGGVLAYRPIQIKREYTVRRAKSAAERQRALALVGASTLKAGADGGLKPELIAQLLLDLALIGVTAGK